LNPDDADRQRQEEVARVGLDVRPFDPDRVDVDGQPARPLEVVAGGAADTQEDAEALARLERAVAEEREVPGLAGDGEAGGGHLGPDRREADERVVRTGPGV